MPRVSRWLYNVGAFAVIGGAGWLHAARLAPESYRFIGSTAASWFAVLAAVNVCVAYAIGLPELATSRTSAALRGLAATIVSFSVIAAFQAMLATPLLPRSGSMLIGVLLPLWSVVAWNVSRDTRDWAATRDRVFLVADRLDDGERLASDLAAGAELPASLVGFLPLDEVRDAGTDPIVSRLAKAAEATIVVLDTAAQAEPAVVEQAASLHRQGVRIRTLALFYEEWLGKLPHTELARVSLLFDIGELHRARYVRSRRIVDLAFATVGLVWLVPLLAAIAVLNPWFNRGPLFFRQDRVGRGGHVFEMWKLRTMVDGTSSTTTRPTGVGSGPGAGIGAGSDAEATTAGAWTTAGDARITPLGRLLRRSHLDELPQVLNILRGDLSLVGPRPEQPHYVEQLAEKMAFYEVRHIVRPGLTGWAQVKQGYAADTDGAFEKLQYDFYYLRRQGLGLDARIVWRTVRGVVRGDGR